MEIDIGIGELEFGSGVTRFPDLVFNLSSPFFFSPTITYIDQSQLLTINLNSNSKVLSVPKEKLMRTLISNKLVFV